MTSDARFEDGAERPLNLGARDGEDLAVVSALAQDAVLTGADLSFDPRRRRFGALLNRYRWETDGAGRHERVRSLLVIDDALAVRTTGIDRRDGDMVLSVLELTFSAGEDGTGEVVLTLAGDGAIAVTVECLEVRLADVTRPYAANAGRAPDHGLTDAD